MVQSRIPVAPHGNHGVLVFNFWAPTKPTDALILHRDGCDIRIWFDRNCVNPLDRREIRRTVNVQVHQVNVDVTVHGVQRSLADFIYEEKDRPKLGKKKDPDERYQELSRLYRDLGERVLKVTLSAFNQLIAYFRAQKGQHWLDPRDLDDQMVASRFNEFQTKVRTPGRGWVRWCPPAEDLLSIIVYGQERYVTRNEWRCVEGFVKQNGARSNLVLELLANAESLLEAGHRRSAIIEAVTALEIATFEFAKYPKIEALDPECVQPLDLDSLHGRAKHLGFSTSIRFLIPLVLDEDIWPSEIREKCLRAVDVRGNVVHNGVRDVSEETIRPLVQSIRKTCKVMALHTSRGKDSGQLRA